MNRPKLSSHYSITALGSNSVPQFYRWRCIIVFPGRSKNKDVLSCLLFNGPGNTVSDRTLANEIVTIKSAKDWNLTQALLLITDLWTNYPLFVSVWIQNSNNLFLHLLGARPFIEVPPDCCPCSNKCSNRKEMPSRINTLPEETTAFTGKIPV